MKSIIIALFLFTSCISAKIDQIWWQSATTYEIFVMSFKDSDGDGIGDLAGITSKLDYLYELGIRVVKLSSIYSSPDNIAPNYYGVDNFTKIHSKLGTLEDFDELITETNKRGIKIILEIDFNHCHSSHEWFQKSVDGVEPFKDYFVWKDPVLDKNGAAVKPPNSGASRRTRLFSWTWVEKRRQFYYSSFNPSLPDFNLYDQGLRKELKNIMKFWLNRGASGFNIKNKSFYFDSYDSKRYAYANYEDTYELLRELREYIDIYNGGNIGHQRILMTDSDICDAYSLKCIGNKDFPLVHIVSNNEFTYFDYEDIFAQYGLAEEIKKYSNFIKEGQISEWKIYELNKARPRNEHDFHSHLRNTIAAVIPGIWHILYGSELGIGGSYVRNKIFIENDFNFGRERILAMHWDDSNNAGFTDSTHPMYQPKPNYWKINAEKEKNEENSLYHFFKDLLEVRQKETMKHGDVDFFKITETSFAIVRMLEGCETYVTVINFSNQLQTINLNQGVVPIPNLAPKSKIVAASPNFFYGKGYRISTSRFTMRPYSSIVLEMEKSKH